MVYEGATLSQIAKLALAENGKGSTNVLLEIGRKLGASRSTKKAASFQGARPDRITGSVHVDQIGKVVSKHR